MRTIKFERGQVTVVNSIFLGQEMLTLVQMRFAESVNPLPEGGTFQAGFGVWHIVRYATSVADRLAGSWAVVRLVGGMPNVSRTVDLGDVFMAQVPQGLTAHEA